jgi:hypothetical protein
MESEMNNDIDFDKLNKILKEEEAKIILIVSTIKKNKVDLKYIDYILDLFENKPVSRSTKFYRTNKQALRKLRKKYHSLSSDLIIR